MISTAKKRLSKSLVIYDGECVLCNRFIKFLLKIDRHQICLFSHVQGKTVTKILQKSSNLNLKGKSVICIKNYGASNEILLTGSDAVLGILGSIGGLWRIVSWLKIIPVQIRDPIYHWIATHRYKWFGKYNQCQLPDEHWKNRFLP